MPTNVELYHYGIKGMRWGHRKARPQMSGAARSARRRKILKRTAAGLGAAAGAAALGYGAYRGYKKLGTLSGAAHVVGAAMRVDQGIDRAKRAGRSAADGASIIGNSVRLAGGIAGKRAANGVSKAAGAAGSYVLGGKRSKTRQKLRQGRAAVETLASAYQTRRKYQGKHAAHFAYDSPGEALYHFALDPYGRYAIL